MFRHTLWIGLVLSVLGLATAPSAGENHFGLIGMTERAKRLGGQLIVDSTPGRGTFITVEIPLEPLNNPT